MFSFEKLNVYSDSLVLIEKLYKISNAFPKHEQYGLCSQLRRASTSIALNIAEGSSRTKKEKVNFLRFSRGSIFEVVAILQICKSLDYLGESIYNDLYIRLEKLAMMISSLIKTIE